MPSTTGQKKVPVPKAAPSSRTTPTAIAPRAMTGPRSVSRRTRPGRLPARVALSSPGAARSNWESDGQHQPQRGVQGDPHTRHGAAPTKATRTQSTGHAEVMGQSRRHAADDRLLAVAVGPAELGAEVDGALMSAPSSHSRAAPDHEAGPRADPEPARRRDQARIRVVPDGRAAPDGAQWSHDHDSSRSPSADSGHGDPQPDAGPRVTGARDAQRRPDPPHRPRRPQGRRGGRRPGPAPRRRPGPGARGAWSSSPSSAAPACCSTARCGCCSPRRARDRAAINLDERSLMAALDRRRRCWPACS